MHFDVAQQLVALSQATAPLPAPALEPVAPAELPKFPALELATPAAELFAPALPSRLSPLPPQADANTAAPENSTAHAQKTDFEEVRMA